MKGLFGLDELRSASCVSSISSHSGQRAEQEQEVGVAVPVQEEVGIGRGPGPDRRGEDGVTSARSTPVQTQEILPLRINRDHYLYSNVNLQYMYIPLQY